MGEKKKLRQGNTEHSDDDSPEAKREDTFRSGFALFAQTHPG
jgi:hypothetical protein